ncbi:hypothetical protein [Methanosphaera sp. BMS]|uniref:hypothetical protein n=1 Tax=Methanosphaera sp. BMS TaxID=1789762 RepID=UPI0013A70A5F|nr:hypothetical protein [Methanosphaera sp. BMS]
MMGHKNYIIALLLSFFINGLGNIYNGLITRGLVELVISVVISLLHVFVSSIFFYIAILWFIYVLYDTYACTRAINNNQAIPLFLTQIDLQ